MTDNQSNKIIVPRFEKANAFYTTNQRSRIILRIKGKNTVQEVLFRKALYCKGVKYRTVNKGFPGNPYIAIRKYKLAVFIDREIFAPAFQVWYPYFGCGSCCMSGFLWSERRP